MNKLFIFGFLTTTTLGLSSCVAPLIIGGGAAVAGMATREKSMAGTVSDTQLSASIKKKFYGFSSDLHSQVNVNVQNTEVLLTGAVKDEAWRVEAEKLCWQVVGVSQVHNYVEAQENIESFGDVTKDGWITTRAKSKMMVLSDVYSLNYNIKTVNGVIYLMGIAQDQTELEKVTKALGEIGGVSKLICLVRIKGEAPAAKSDTSLKNEEKS
jgi:osmotically-inducible protein OsmY